MSLEDQHLAANSKQVFYTAKRCSRTQRSLFWFDFWSIFSGYMNYSNRCFSTQSSGTRACIYVCFGGLGKGRMGLLQKVPLKDIWICLACQVDALSCWERRSSWSFQSLQHWGHDTPGYHSNSWEAHTFKRNQIQFAQRPLTEKKTKASQALYKRTYKSILHIYKHFNLSKLVEFLVYGESKLAQAYLYSS